MGVNTTRRILGEARKARPPTKRELKDPEKAYFYAEGKLAWGDSRRFPEGEATIATDPNRAKIYLREFPEAKLEWAMNGWLDWLDL